MLSKYSVVFFGRDSTQTLALLRMYRENELSQTPAALHAPSTDVLSLVLFALSFFLAL